MTWLTAAVMLALGLALVGSGSAGGGQPSTALQSFPLYNAGERVDGLPLVAVLRREDTARFVSFVYGDCVAGDDAGCAPPAEIQVWPACSRNLGLYDGDGSAGAPAEEITVRGVPALLFDEGTRLELEAGDSTAVIFAGDRVRVLRVAAALRAVDGTVLPGRPLPKPTRGRKGGALGC
ncbi:hypothetical protein BH18ACT13_BH18ACT13_16620 [soil metagenome]